MAGQRIGAAATWLMTRAPQYSSTIYNTTIYEAASSNTTSTQMLINELKFAVAKSIRTSTVILASFNAIAAFATACGILYDAYSTRRRDLQRYRTRTRPSFIQAADTYPLVLSFGIVMQGIAFAVAQAQGLKSILKLGCTIVSQFVFPAVFLVPYIQVVFSMETALRGLRRKPFPKQQKYTTTVCLAIVCMLVLANFLIADFDRAPDFCFASLFWYIAIYSKGSFVALLVIDVILVICLIIISVRLTRSFEIETSERAAASRMVYFLALSILSDTLIIPFFFSIGFIDQKTTGGPALNWSMVASVVANLSGLTTGGLHLFMRSGILSAIGPHDKSSEYDRRWMKDQIRRYNASDPDFAGHMMGPVSSAVDLRHMLSDASPISGSHEDKDEESGMRTNQGALADGGLSLQTNPLRSNAFNPSSLTTTPATATLAAVAVAAAGTSVRVPEPAKMPAAMAEARPSHSSLTQWLTSALSSAPTARASAVSDTKSLLLLPATTYSPGPAKPAARESTKRFDFSTLKPPPSMNNLVSGRHRRDSSMVSTATVQIGLRLSNMADLGLAPVDTQILDRKVYTLDDASGDIQPQAESRGADQRQSGMIPIATDMTKAYVERHSPKQPTALPSPILLQPRSFADTRLERPSTADSQELPVADAAPRRDARKDERMKTLPPVPRPVLGVGQRDVRTESSEDDEDDADDAEDVMSDASGSASLYSSQSSTKTKLPSPRGVGFATIPSRSNSTTARTATVVHVAGHSVEDKTAGDWI